MSLIVAVSYALYSVKFMSALEWKTCLRMKRILNEWAWKVKCFSLEEPFNRLKLKTYSLRIPLGAGIAISSLSHLLFSIKRTRSSQCQRHSSPHDEILVMTHYHFGRSLKAHANGRNKSQYCCVLLGVFRQQCCVRLHGPKNLTGFKLYATNANIVVVPCKRTQHVGPNSVASVCMALYQIAWWLFHLQAIVMSPTDRRTFRWRTLLSPPLPYKEVLGSGCEHVGAY